MLIRPFTPEDYPAIVEIHNGLNIVWPERPHTPEAWAEVDRNRSPKTKYQRWVAVEDGRAVGFASYSQGPGAYPAQSFYLNVEVAPQYQRRGIGAALYAQVMQGLAGFNPPALRADAFANLPQGFAFLQKRGFYEAFRETPVHLDVTAFDPAPYAGLEARLSAQGIVIKTLRQLEPDPERNRKLYDLYWEANEDVPHEGEGEQKPDFEDWLAWGLNDPTILPDAYFVAVRGDEYIGLRELAKYPGSDLLMGGLLGVRRAYRKQNIGLAMQLRGIAYAQENGYRVLKTCTAVQNAPMQALFNKLGYVRDPEWQQCQKDIHTYDGGLRGALMENKRLSLKEWGARGTLALVFVALGLLIYIVFSPLRPMLEMADDYLGRIGLAAGLLAAVWLAGKRERAKPYWPLLLGLLIMIVAVSLDWVFAIYLLKHVGLNSHAPSGIALLKLNEFFIVASTVIVLTLLSGGSLGSIYIQKGNLKVGLLVGGIAFCLAAAGATWMAGNLFKGQNLTLEQITAWLPWVLIFVLANAAQEELLFRGLFLRKLQPFFGKFLSNALIVFVFTLVHQGVNYTSDQLGFLAVLALLAFAWGYLMQKTDSIWGSILFHAGMDIPVILGIFSNL